MGLDVTARGNVELLEVMENYQAFEDKYGWNDDTLGYIHPGRQDFPDRLPPMVPGGVYKTYGEVFDFRGGSYSGYNEWRDQLSQLMLGSPAKFVWGHRPMFVGRPFYELIDFSDATGIIGTIACQKLAGDFARFQEKADMHPDGYFREKYAQWRRAFEIAAQGGYVDFS